VANFSTIFASVVEIGDKFAKGVNDAGGKLPQLSTTQAANLPPVSTTPVTKIAAGINDTGAYLPPVSTIPAANLPPVSMVPVENCRRYQRHPWQTMGTIIKLLTT
jgi:hypothetical protein